MGHYVFTVPGDDQSRGEKILFVAMHIGEIRAIEIAHELTRDYAAAGELPRGVMVDYEEVQAYVPRGVMVGDVVTGASALTLPVGSIIVRTRDEWGPMPATTPLIRRGRGYIAADVDGAEPTPVKSTHYYKILHIGGTTP